MPSNSSPPQREQNARKKHRRMLLCVQEQVLYRFRLGSRERDIAKAFGAHREEIEDVIRAWVQEA